MEAVVIPHLMKSYYFSFQCYSSSRIAQVSEQLERLLAVEKTSRDLEQLRYVTLKTYQLLQAQGLMYSKYRNLGCMESKI